jgi:hypothetical protein
VSCNYPFCIHISISFCSSLKLLYLYVADTVLRFSQVVYTVRLKISQTEFYTKVPVVPSVGKL